MWDWPWRGEEGWGRGWDLSSPWYLLRSQVSSSVTYLILGAASGGSARQTPWHSDQ